MKRFIALTLAVFCLSVTAFSQENALNFDGVDDYVDIGSPYAGGSNYTKEAWVYVTNITGNRNIMSSLGDVFWISGGQLTAGNGGNFFNTVDPGTFPTNVWVHVAVTYDGTNLTLYRNGVQVAQTASGASAGGSTNIGSYPNPNSSNFEGSMDEVRIWNYARTSTEIANNYNHAVLASSVGLVRYYKFNQGVAGGNNTAPPIDVATDATGTLPGTLVSFALIGATSNWVASQFFNLLPVSLIRFTASVEGKSVVLNWITSGEMNSQRFEIERSADGGRSWKTLGSVQAAGNASVNLNYRFSDAQPVYGNNLYRLKQIDIDQAYKYSVIIAANLKGEGVYTIYPNPVREQLYISSSSQDIQPLTVRIRNSAGQDVRVQQTTQTGLLVLQLNQLDKGIYFIQVSGALGTANQKIIKQ